VQWLTPVIPGIWEAETVGQLRQNISETLSQTKSQAWWYSLVISTTREMKHVFIYERPACAKVLGHI
jgi:hypothetical protein